MYFVSLSERLWQLQAEISSRGSQGLLGEKGSLARVGSAEEKSGKNLGNREERGGIAPKSPKFGTLQLLERTRGGVRREGSREGHSGMAVGPFL